MIKTKSIKIKPSNKNKVFYKKKGYDIECEFIEVKIEDLPSGSKYKIDAVCNNCGREKQMEYRTYLKITETGKYYCSKCKNIKTSDTVKEKYGVDNIFQLDTIKEKTKNTLQNKYGKNYYSQTSEYKEKFKKTSQKKYGKNHPMQSEGIKRKVIETNIKIYGVGCVLKNENIQKKIQKTNKERYGEIYPVKNKDVQEKIKRTNNKEYNCNYPFENENILNKRIDTYIKNYGVDNPMKDDIIKDKSLSSKNDNKIAKYQKYGIFDMKDGMYLGKCLKGHSFEITNALLYNRVSNNKTVCTHCNPISANFSDIEKDFVDFIKNIYSKEIILNSRQIIPPYELDIYLPDEKIAFEFNGLYWHSEIYKDDNYHFNKTEETLKKNIHLIHVYEDDWLYKKEIVKSRILNILQIIPEKIYARKTLIKKISDNKTVKDFLRKNHIQGYVSSGINIGLYFNGELVSLMTFGSKRKLMGSKNREGEYELLRFCNKLNMVVIGGANKLFKYFIDNYNPKMVLTYADRSWSKGTVYEKMGFTFVDKTRPNYYYIVDGIRKHRYGYRKNILVKEGYDKEKSEHEIMLNRKIYRVYDSGHLKYEYVPT